MSPQFKASEDEVGKVIKEVQEISGQTKVSEAEVKGVVQETKKHQPKPGTMPKQTEPKQTEPNRETGV